MKEPTTLQLPGSDTFGNEETLYFLRALTRIAENVDWKRHVGPWLIDQHNHFVDELVRTQEPADFHAIQGVVLVLKDLINVTDTARALARHIEESKEK